MGITWELRKCEYFISLFTTTENPLFSHSDNCKTIVIIAVLSLISSLIYDINMAYNNMLNIICEEIIILRNWRLPEIKILQNINKNQTTIMTSLRVPYNCLLSLLLPFLAVFANITTMASPVRRSTYCHLSPHVYSNILASDRSESLIQSIRSFRNGYVVRNILFFQIIIHITIKLPV